MATKQKAKAEPVKPRNVVTVKLRDRNENPDEAAARELTRPSLQAASTIQRWQGNNHEVNALAKELAAQIATANRGDLSRAEGMLLAQAHTLDEIFNSLARRSHLNMGEYLNAADTYLRLALKAQSQCRATLEALATIKNPPVIYARQANVTTGPQQVNNGMPSPSRAREPENLQSKLLEVQDGERLDSTAAGAAGDTDSRLATVGAINGTEDGKGKG